MTIVKTDVPMTSALNWQTVEALSQRYPALRRETLTWTAFGRPVPMLLAGTGRRKVLFAGAFHANEWITAPVILKFMEELAQAQEDGGTIGGTDARTLLGDVTILAIPMVNPDGVDLVTGAIAPDTAQYSRGERLAANYPGIPFPDGWRANLMGVDLNLQYPAGWRKARDIKFSQGYTRPGPRDYVGAAPLNQRESFALVQLTRRFSPDLVLALHSQGQVIYWQFEDYVVPGARELGEKMAQVSGYTLADTPYNSSFAGFKDWFIQAFRRPGYTIEVGQGENPLPISQFDSIYDKVLGAMVIAAKGD